MTTSRKVTARRAVTLPLVATLAALSALGASTLVGSAPAQADSTSQSYFTASQTPQVATDPDATGVELGMKFKVREAGQVTSLRFYKGGSANSGRHVGSLWNSAGKRLRKVTFTSESSSGWQEVDLAKPRNLRPGRTYVVSYFAPKGRYSASENFFGSAKSSGLIDTPTNAGIYTYASTSAFPTSTYRASNYWVDIVFRSSTTPTPEPTPDPTPEPTPDPTPDPTPRPDARPDPGPDPGPDAGPDPGPDARPDPHEHDELRSEAECVWLPRCEQHRCRPRHLTAHHQRRRHAQHPRQGIRERDRQRHHRDHRR